MPPDRKNSRSMPAARILDRDSDNLLMIAPIAAADRAGPRLRGLYPVDEGAEGRGAAFLTARALAMRGMRILGQAPVPLSARADAPPDWGAGMGGSISYAAQQVGVWLCRDATRSPGLNLMRTGDPPDQQAPEEIALLDRLPGLARMTRPERLAAAQSARRALAKALWPRVGAGLAPGCAVVVPAQQSGITLSLTRGIGPGLESGMLFRVELRVFPDLVLTRISVPRRADPRCWH